MGNIGNTMTLCIYSRIRLDFIPKSIYDIVLISLPFSDQREYKTALYKKLAETTATSVSCS